MAGKIASKKIQPPRKKIMRIAGRRKAMAKEDPGNKALKSFSWFN